MNKVYVSHASGFDFQKELYAPLKKLTGVELVLPHENSKGARSSKNIIKDCSIVIAEVSVPSHGVGVELGWANAFGVPIICISKRGSLTSPSLKILSKEFLEYDQLKDVLPKLYSMIACIAKH